MKLFCVLGVVSLLSVVELAATSISEFACQKRNLAVTVNAHLELLFIDGIEITNLPNADIWNGPDVVDLPCTARLIAIHGRCEPGWGKAAILGSTDDEYVLTDSSWKCSNVSHFGWEQLDFDDSTWVSAIEYSHNGEGNFLDFVPGISTNAEWIWLRLALPTDEVIDAEVYCRKRLALSFCSSSPCAFGGTCIEEPNGGYQCICAPGYSGQNCSTEINYCESSPCVNEGSCEPIVNGYVCQCQPGYTDDNCEEVTNNCVSFPCLNGGTCLNGINYYVCVCSPEWTGVNCDTPINYCESSPCTNGGSCEPIVNGYVCQCPPGYTDDHCEEVINYCESDPCVNGGSCLPIVNGYVCQCPPGYTDDNCDDVTNNCASLPCLNGGTCLNGVNYYVCECPPEWTGVRCDILIIACNPNPCLNGGTCNYLGGDSFTCTCPIYFTVEQCESPNYNEAYACGTTLTWSQYNASNGFTRLCYFWTNLEDTEGRFTECRLTIKGIPLYGDYIGLLNAGGNFGCVVSQNYPKDLPATSYLSCADNYQQDVSLGIVNESDRLMVCIRYPYEGAPGRK